MGILLICEEQKNEKIIFKNIKKALRILNISSIIAEDGGREENINSNKIDRALDTSIQGDELLRGLYLHRLTQFSDFGKVFGIACNIIILIYEYKNNKSTNEVTFSDFIDNNAKAKEIRESINHIIENDKLSKNLKLPQENVLNQKKLNGHFSSHYKSINNLFESYIRNYDQYEYRFSSLIQLRNIVISDFFKVMSGYPYS